MPRIALPTQPLTGANFRVDLGDGEARGFCAVTFPPFGLGRDTAVAPPVLALKRAATGGSELYDWWNAARDPAGQAPPRLVQVELLSADLTRIALRWRFLGCRPRDLAYSPLDAMLGGIVFETLTLGFDRVEMGDPPPPKPK